MDLLLSVDWPALSSEQPLALTVVRSQGPASVDRKSRSKAMNETTTSKLETYQCPLAHEVDGVTRWLALCGVVGPVVFVLMFTLAGVVAPGTRRFTRR